MTRDEITFEQRPLAILFGDSITQKGFSTAEAGWCAELSDYWVRKVDVLNRGYSGYNTMTAKRIFTSILQNDVVHYLKTGGNAANLFFTVFFGANDAAVEESMQFIPVYEYQDNLRDILQMIYNVCSTYSSGKPTILLITCPPIWEPALAEWNRQMNKPATGQLINRKNERALTYSTAMKEVASEFGLPVVDTFSAMEGNSNEGDELYPTVGRGSYLIDGLHLNRRGNQKLAKVIIDALEGKQSEFVIQGDDLHKWSAKNLPTNQLLWMDAIQEALLLKKD